MRKKILIIILALGLLVNADLSAVKAAEKSCKEEIDVPKYGTWIIHGIYEKAEKAQTVRVVNYSGYGYYAYSYCVVKGKLGLEWSTLSSETKIHKNDKNTVIKLSNTVDPDKKVSFRFTGNEKQTGEDLNCIKVKY